MGISILVVGERKGAVKEEEGARRRSRRRRRRKVGIGAQCQPIMRKGWLWPLVLVCSSEPASLLRKRDSSERVLPESGRVSITIIISSLFLSFHIISPRRKEGRKEGGKKAKAATYVEGKGLWSCGRGNVDDVRGN